MAQEVNDLKEDMRQAATISDLNRLHKVVDGLPTFQNITTLEDKFKTFTKLDTYTEFRNLITERL